MLKDLYLGHLVNALRYPVSPRIQDIADNPKKVGEAVVALGHKCATVNVMVVGSITARGNELFNIYISSLW